MQILGAEVTGSQGCSEVNVNTILKHLPPPSVYHQRELSPYPRHHITLHINTILHYSCKIETLGRYDVL